MNVNSYIKWVLCKIPWVVDGTNGVISKDAPINYVKSSVINGCQFDLVQLIGESLHQYLFTEPASVQLSLENINIMVQWGIILFFGPYIFLLR